MSTQRLRTMLSYIRTRDGAGEHAFRARYLDTLPGATRDAFGNIHVCVSKSRTLFTAHTDTVHVERAIRQPLTRSDHWLSARASSCLGADDGVGLYLLTEMIRAQVPGYYLFTYGEESGGIGARAAARAFDWSTFERAIAIDRRGTRDIITHQLGRRMASDVFAHALADALGLGHAPAHGIYTDTAEFSAVIPECTNISAGYEHEHTPEERVNVAYVARLRRALLRVNWETLPTVRAPFAPSARTFEPAVCDLCGREFYASAHTTCETCLFN